VCLSQEIIAETTSVLIPFELLVLTPTRDLCLTVLPLVEGEAFATALLSDPRKEKHLANLVASSAT
jgi:hypothetical protein